MRPALILAALLAAAPATAQVPVYGAPLASSGTVEGKPFCRDMPGYGGPCWVVCENCATSVEADPNWPSRLLERAKETQRRAEQNIRLMEMLEQAMPVRKNPNRAE